jgi:hypothetical protein
MGFRFWLSLLKWPVAFMALASLLAGAYTVNGWIKDQRAAESDNTEPPKRASEGVIKLGTALAESHGIKDEPAQSIVWYPSVIVYGRVVPNPQATVEVRSPFAGTLRADADNPWPAQGRWVRSGQVLGRLNIRAGPQERLDLQAKLAEARAKHEGAEDVLNVQQERLNRLLKEPGIETLVRDDLDKARVLVAEARAQVTAAKAGVELWQKALDALNKHGDRADSAWTEPLTAPSDGEVTELAAKPGMAIEAGGLIARLVDFRRPLVRLDLSPEVLAAGPPPTQVDVSAVPAVTQAFGSVEPAESSAITVSATLVGPAGSVDVASQLVGYWYEVSPAKKPAPDEANSGGTSWRPGLFVQCHMKTAGAKPQQAVSVPRNSLLFHLGRPLVYVRIGSGRYQRREVRVLGHKEDHWVLAGGVAAGEPVVHQQAQVLLSEEFKPQGDMDND